MKLLRITNDQLRPRLSAAAICIFLAVMVWVVFGQTLGFGFVNYDDGMYVYENPIVIAGLSLHGIGWAFTHSLGGNWHPLTTISLMMDCQFFGLKPWGYHLTNVLLHGASTILLFLALRQMTGALWRSAFVAAVFAIHPLHVESVAWVAERKDVLSGVFFMLTLWAYAGYAQRPASRECYYVVITLFALGLMCKPTLVTLPFVLLLLDYWPLQRFGEESDLRIFPVPRHLILEKIPLFFLSACSCVATILAQKEAYGAVEMLSFPDQIANALVSYMVYLEEMIYPAGLAVFYPFPATYLPWEVLLAITVLASISSGIYVLRRKHPFLPVGWLWYLGMLVPMIGLIQVGAQAHADRYTYLPQIGLYIAAIWILSDLSLKWQRGREAACAAAVIIIMALAWCARAQAYYWRNSEALWRHTLACTENNDTAYNNLGIVLVRPDQEDEAIAVFLKALDINPDSAKAHYNLGNAFQKKEQLNQAVLHYQKALEINPDYVDAHINLGAILRQEGETNEAIEHFQQALQIEPENAAAHNNLGLALLRNGEADEAIAHLQKAIEIDPGYAEAHNNLGLALLHKKQLNEAASHFQKALAIKPDYAEAHYNLGIVLERNQQTNEAIAQYQKALEISPNYADALNNLALLLATCPQALLRNGAKAVELAEQANRSTSGNDPAILGTLAAAYAETGQFSKAVETAQHAVDVANSQSNAALANLLRSHIALYQTHTPLRYNDPGKQ